MPYQGRIPAKYPDTNYKYTLEPGSVTSPTLSFLNDSNNGLWSPATDNLAISTNGSEKLRVTDTGNVGINTTSPQNKLHVVSTANFIQYPIKLENSGTSGITLGAGLAINVYNGTSISQLGGIVATASTWNYGTYLPNQVVLSSSGSGGVRIAAANAPIIFYSGNSDADYSSERVRISSNGNVGIGTTNPSEKLHVYSSGAVASVNIDSSNSGTSVYYSLNGLKKYTSEYVSASDFYSIGRSSVAYDLVLKSGNVGIGTANPTAKLDILAGSGTTALLISNNAALSFIDSSATARRAALVSASNNFYYGDVDNATTGSNLFLLAKSSITFFNNGVSNITISASGNLTPEADATQNLGSSTKRWANIYSADLQLSNEGSQNDVDGTWGQYTIQEGENDLFLLNRRNGKKYKFVLQEVG